MTVERNKIEIIFKLPPDTDILSLQKIMNYLKYKEAIKNSTGTEKDAEEIAKSAKSNWWSKNKDRFIK